MNEPKRPQSSQSLNTPQGGDLGTSKTIQSELLSNQMAQERVLGDKSFSQSSRSPAPALRQKPKSNLLLRTLVGGGLLFLAGVAIYFGLLAYRKNIDKNRTSGLSNQFGTTSFDLSNLSPNGLAGESGLVVINGNTTVNGGITANSYSGSGADLSNVNASLLNSRPASFYQDANNLTSGTLSDARLSGNVALLNVSQAFTGDNTFSGNSSFVKLMVSGTTTLNGTVVINNSLTTSGDTTVGGTLGVNGLVYSWPGVQANGILANDGAGNLAWQAVGACASCITDGGNAFGSSISIGTNDANTLSFRTNGVNHLTVDTAGLVGIGNSTPAYALDVNGDVNLATGNIFRIGGTAICTSGGCAAQSGSGSYIQNSASLQTGANFNFEVASISSVGGAIRGAVGQTANLQEWQDSNGIALTYVAANGNLNVPQRFDNNPEITFGGNSNVGLGYNAVSAILSINTPAIQGGTGSVVISDNRLYLNSGLSSYIEGTTATFTTFHGALYADTTLKVSSSGSLGTVEKFRVNTPTTVDNLANVMFSTSAITSKGLVIQSVAGQTANLQEWQASDAQVLAKIGSTGNLTIGTNTSASANTNGTLILQGYYSGGSTATSLTFTGGGSDALIRNSGTNSIQIKPTLFFMVINSFDSNSPFTVNARSGAQTYQTKVAIQNAGTTGLVVNGATSQTASLQEWQSSTGAVLGKVTAAGSLQFSATGSNPSIYGNSTSDNGIEGHSSSNLASKASIVAQPLAADSRGLIVKGFTSQTANLQEWQDSTGAVLSNITSGGALSFGTAPASAGNIRLPNATSISWRNAANTGDKSIKLSSVNVTDALDLPGSVVVGGSDATGGTVYFFNATTGIGRTGNSGLKLFTGNGTTGLEVLNNSKNNAVGIGAASDFTNGTVEKFRVNSPTTVDNAANIIFATTATSSKGLVIQGIVNQSANLQEWQSSTGTALAYINATGDRFGLALAAGKSFRPILADDTVNNIFDLDYNGQINVDSSVSGSIIRQGQNGVHIFTHPAGSSTLTDRLTVSADGAIQQRGYVAIQNTTSSGQANLALQIADDAGNNQMLRVQSYTFGVGKFGNGVTSSPGTLTVYGSDTTTPTVIARAIASQTSNLQEWQDSSGAVIAKVDSLGRATFGSSSTGLSGVTATGTYAGLSAASYGGTAIYANAQSTATVGLKVQSASVLYTGDLQRWDPGGVTASSVTNSGFFKIGATGTLGTVEKLRISDPTTADNSANVMIAASASTSKGLVIQAAAGQSANLQEWQNSTGLALTSIQSSGSLYSPTAPIKLGFNVALQAEYSAGGGFVNLAYRGSGNDIYLGDITNGTTKVQASTYVHLNTGGGSTGFYSGIVYPISGSGYLGNGFSSPWKALYLQSINTTSTPLFIRANASQTANLSEWQDSTGVVKSLVDSSGRIVVGSSMNSIPAAIGINNYTTTSNDLVIQHGDSFGGIVMVNYGTPGSNFGGKLTLGHADGTFASPTQPGSGRIVGTVNFNAWETGSSFQNVASIQAAVDTASGTGDWPGRLVFNTTPDGSTTPAERMRIDNAGNIYIGNGATSATPTSGILGATGGAGTNIAGANLTLAGGRGTGTGVGGNIVFQYAAAGVSGAAANTLTAACTISGTNGSLSCPGAGVNSQRFGSGSTAAANTSVAVGYQSQAFAGANSVAIGANSSVYTTGGGGIAIGGSSIAGCLFGCAGNSDAISIGNGSQAGGNYSIIIGNSTLSYTYNGVIALGTAITPTAANQLVIGSSTSSITNGYIGNGVTNAAPAGFSLNATGGLGSNIAGANLTFAGGISTGSANGGALNFQTSKASGSSSSANSLSTVFSLSGGLGAATFQNTANGTGAFIITDSAATNNVVNVDTTNDRVAIGAGTANPTVTLDVLSAGADGSTVAQFKNAGATSCTVQPGGTGFACSSDARLKTNVLTLSDASDVVNKLRGVSFNWITNPNGQGQSGFIAQELEQLIPNAVSTDSNGYKVANYSAIIPYLVEALKQQQTDITALKAGQTPQGGTSVDVLKILADAKVVSLSGDLTVGGNVAVKGRLETSNANSGVVIIPAGQTTIHVTYPQVFSIAPRPSLTPKGVVKTYFGVTNETKTGFDIELSDPLTTDAQFNWQAL